MVDREAPASLVRGALHTVPSCLSVALPVLLWSTCVLAAVPLEVKEASGEILRVEVGPEGAATRPIRIGPGLSTTLMFDTDIVQEQVSLEGRAQFARVSAGNSLLVLVPSGDVRLGETLKLSIPFKDATLPARLVLTLEVQATAVDRQVEVYRRARSAESYRQEVEQLRAELARLRQRPLPTSGGRAELDGFRSLLSVTGPLEALTMDTAFTGISCARPCPLRLDAVLLLRGGERRAVQLTVRSEDGLPWTIRRAVLTDRGGHASESLPPLQTAPVTPGSSVPVTVEFDLKGNRVDGPFMLQLWDEAGKRSAVFSGLKFP
ncbi:DUF2381 family protein [Corallococcus sp. CA053C]|uniref:DUF2381 family protein n=1 Tax=Corallococcus sp. CA053C TaxID=2316732 RepID=UPI000EA18DC1|nr:DUF2381 family protein [Corallococcus sp. CA053C]RKG98106.1 DUF2381 family protein [Corallococcus sp. CA053C]